MVDGARQRASRTRRDRPKLVQGLLRMEKRRTILLVEDSVSEVTLVLHAFQKSGVAAEIVVAMDGEDALEYLLATGRHSGRDRSPDPRVMLLDIHLPGGLDGIDV